MGVVKQHRALWNLFSGRVEYAEINRLKSLITFKQGKVHKSKTVYFVIKNKSQCEGAD